METHAYSEMYLSHVMENLAVMFDCGINFFGIPAEMFYSMFITSGVAGQIENGNPKYLVGYSGLELAEIVIEHSGGAHSEQIQGHTFMVRTPEYWAGWVLAYYQWRSCRYFTEIQRKGLTFSKITALYHPLHEADLEKFYDVAEDIAAHAETTGNPLKEARERMGLTQRELSDSTGISLRMIRAYEQKQQALSKAEYNTVVKLAKALRTSANSLL